MTIVDAFTQDLRYSLRMCRRSPGFVAVVTTVLALGIGANTAIFTFINALLFSPLPGRGAQLVGVYSHDEIRPDAYRRFSYPNYVDLRAQGDTFDALLAHTFTTVGIPSGDTTRRAFVDIVSSNFFTALGVPLAAGRTFTAAEERPGAAIPVVIVGYEYWKRSSFDAAILGTTLRLNTHDFTVVGVAPEGFTGTTPFFGPEGWIPLGMYDAVISDELKQRTALADRRTSGLLVAGVLKPGLSAGAANARLDVVSAGLRDAYPDANRNQVISVQPLSRVSLSTGPQSDTPVILASALVMLLPGAVLLIACLNVANMLLARASVRRREMAIRLALGGGRGRIVGQLLTEGMLLALAGAVGGIAIAGWTTRAILASLGAVLPVTLRVSPPLDPHVLVAVLVFTMLSVLLCSLAPALNVSRPDVTADLKDDGAQTGGRGRWPRRSWLVVGQIAVSLVLVAIGGSVAIGSRRAAATDPGFRYDGLLLVSTDAAMAGYDEATGRATILRVLERIRALPGVASASVASLVPFGDSHEGRGVERPGMPDPGRRAPTYTLVGSDYFKSLGLPVLRGREFTEAEMLAENAPLVAIIDERLATRLFAGEDPIGQSIRLSNQGAPSTPATPGPSLEVVGIVPSVQDELIERVPTTHLYVPLGAAYRPSVFIHVRTAAGGEAALADVVGQEIRRTDARLPILELTPMRRFHERGLLLWAMRASGTLLGAFGLLALALAAIGVYGVRSYVVSQRRREIGIRMALGAQPANVMRLLLGDSARMAALGLSIGLPVAVVIAFVLGRLTNGTLTLAPLALVGAPVVLSAAAALASWVPARRATRISPLDAIRR